MLASKMKLSLHVSHHHETSVDVMKEPWMTADKDACARMDSVDKMAFVFLEIVIKY